MDKKILERAGLSKGEIEVYLTLLKLGSSLVSKIAQETGDGQFYFVNFLQSSGNLGLSLYSLSQRYPNFH